MEFQTPVLAPAAAEITLLTLTCVVLLVDAFLSQARRDVTYLLTLLTIVSTAFVVAFMTGEGAQVTFSGHFVNDPMARVLKLVVLATTGMVFLYSRDYLARENIYRGEFFVLALFATLGMMVMISAHSLLSVYLGLELLSLSLYALVAFNRDSGNAAEAAMKYFVLGAIASGCLLYGMSLIYGAAGTLDLAELSARIADGATLSDLWVLVGLAFLLVGIAFKFGAVPFHMWLPDVYQGTPTPVTLFVGSAPKVAAFAMAIRLLVDGLGSIGEAWQSMLIVLAVASMALGNIVAIAQTNIKRMLAYSTISHVGFILMGILSGSEDGYRAAMYYTIAYVIMATAAFGMVILLSRRGFEAENLDDFKGLNRRSPWFAGMMLIVMFSMAGVPPFLGFYAKIAVIAAAVDANLTWLAILAVVLSVIGAFYYLRIVKLMYFDDPADEPALEGPSVLKLALSFNGLLILALGLFPNGLIAVCQHVFG
jgi:NADH-quinone oxidoreductase subunit N